MHSINIECIFYFYKKNRIILHTYVNDMDNKRNIHKGILCVTEEL